MKKQYIVPTTNKIVIKTTGLLASSPGQSSTPASVNSDGNYVSLGRDGWFDDDEE